MNQGLESIQDAARVRLKVCLVNGVTDSRASAEYCMDQGLIEIGQGLVGIGQGLIGTSQGLYQQ